LDFSKGFPSKNRISEKKKVKEKAFFVYFFCQPFFEGITGLGFPNKERALPKVHSAQTN